MALTSSPAANAPRIDAKPNRSASTAKARVRVRPTWLASVSSSGQSCRAGELLEGERLAAAGDGHLVVRGAQPWLPDPAGVVGTAGLTAGADGCAGLTAGRDGCAGLTAGREGCAGLTVGVWGWAGTDVEVDGPVV